MIIIIILILISAMAIILVYKSKIKDLESDNKVLSLQLTDCKVNKIQSLKSLVSMNIGNEYIANAKLRLLTIINSIPADEKIRKSFRGTVDITIPPKPQLPTISQLNDSNYSSSIATLNLYLIEIAYAIDTITYPDSSNEANVRKLITSFLPAGISLKQILRYSCNGLTGDTFSYGGIIVEYQGVTFIALRGTYLKCEIYQDLRGILMNPSWITNTSVKVHTGFNSTYIYKTTLPSLREQIWTYINSNILNIKNLIISGHSLGGAVCNLLMYDITMLKPSLRAVTKAYTYAAPYTGNQAFVDALMKVNKSGIYSGIFGIINTLDPVPTTGAFYYVKIPTQRFCFADKGDGSLGAGHGLTIYENGIANNFKTFDDQAKTKQSCGIACP